MDDSIDLLGYCGGSGAVLKWPQGKASEWFGHASHLILAGLKLVLRMNLHRCQKFRIEIAAGKAKTWRTVDVDDITKFSAASLASTQWTAITYAALCLVLTVRKYYE